MEARTVTAVQDRETCDALVVGGGPAGAAAAFHLARAGARVTLLEKETLPRYKTCGGGVVARAAAAAREMVDVGALAEDACSRGELHYGPHAGHVSVQRRSPFVFMTMRSSFDAALARAAVQAGATLATGEAVQAVREDGSGVSVATTRRTHRAEFLVAADGVHSAVARQLGWPDERLLIPALEYELAVAPEERARFAGVARFDFDDVPHGYAWIFPKREHLSAGILSVRRGEKELARRFQGYLERAGIRPVHGCQRHGHLIPVRPRARLTAGRTLLAGDAAGLADPVTCEGISFALLSGRLAAESVLAGQGDPDRVRRSYRERLAELVLPELAAGRLLARALYGSPAVRRWIFRRYGTSLCEAITGTLSGELTFHGLLRRPRSYWRLLFPAGRSLPTAD